MGLLVLVGLFLLGQYWSVPYYALTPGDARPVAPLISVTGLKTDTHRDTIMLTDVYLSSLNLWRWLTMHLQSHVEFVPASALVEPGVPTSQIEAQGYLEMADSKLAAEVAALRALGWRVPVTSQGATVTAVVASSPAFGHLHVADRIVRVNGRAVRNACSLVSVVHALAPGSTVHLGVDVARIGASGALSYSSARTISLVTRASSSLGASSCPGVTGPDRSYLGIALENALHARLPGTIRVDTSSIGGPSAGLAMTLALIDRLSAGSLTGHHVIAATGTIAMNGAVGDVGGVAEKTVAVARAGASVFLVPSVEVATARSAAPAGLKVLGVNSLRQALADLRALGGAAPVPLSAPR